MSHLICEETLTPSLLARNCVVYSGRQIVGLISHILHCRLGKIVDYGSVIVTAGQLETRHRPSISFPI
jgi:hypothetical protein